MSHFAWLRAALAALIVATSPLPSSAALPDSERSVLVDLYAATQGDGWVNHDNWLSDDPCGPAPWFGVICSSGPDHHVTEIHLSSNNLSGIMPSLSPLTRLQKINISDNQLTGPLPNLSGLSELEAFWGSNNHFNGPLPDLPQLTALGYFYVNGNQLTGPIPDISGLSSLRDFRVSTNQLTGTPPAAPSGLIDGGSSLCPNFLHSPSPSDAQWSQATGELEWWRWCTPGYLVTASAGPGGSIQAPQTLAVAIGQTSTFTLVPEDYHFVDTVNSTCGGTLEGNIFTTGEVNGDCTVTVSFSPVTYAVTPSAGPGGAISPAGVQMVARGDNFSFALLPQAGYMVATVNSSCGGILTGNTFLTGPVNGECTVAASFKLAPVAPIPTLGEWAVLFTGLFAAGMGAWRLRKKQTRF